MIKGINVSSGGAYLQSGTSGYTPYVSPSSNNPLTGMIRVNGNQHEVFDGNSWLQMGSYADISLNQTAVAALDWCQRKMVEEAKITELAKNNPTIADALETYNEARSRLEVVLTLTDAQ